MNLPFWQLHFLVFFFALCYCLFSLSLVACKVSLSLVVSFCDWSILQFTFLVFDFAYFFLLLTIIFLIFFFLSKFCCCSSTSLDFEHEKNSKEPKIITEQKEKITKQCDVVIFPSRFKSLNYWIIQKCYKNLSLASHH